MEKQQKKKEAKLTRALEPHKDFGMISKSKVYISKKGWGLCTPDGKEINIPWGEIQLAFDGTDKLIIPIERCKALKKDNPDAECSDCRAGVEDTEYWYFIDGKVGSDYVQFCDKCYQRRISK